MKQTIDIPQGATAVEIETTATFVMPDVPVPNLPPIVSPGTTATIQLPVDSVILNSAASDPDGKITAYEWSGPGKIATPNQPSTLVNGLTEGSHVFRLVVTDDDGATAETMFTVIVKAAVVVPPVQGYELMYENGFDKPSDIDPWNRGQKGNGFIDTAVFKTGPGCFHAKPKSGVSSGIRSEVQFPNGFIPKEGAIEFDINIIKRAINNAHFSQIHPDTAGASACPGLLWSRKEGVAITFKEIDDEPEYIFFKPVLNTWYNIRFEYLLSTDSDGYWKAYVDGMLKVDHKGRTQLDNKGYLKLGINSWSVSETANEALYDNLKIYKKV